MLDIIRQIHEADRAGLYYMALFGTLTLPDICAALESADNRATGKRYMEWYERWVMPRFAIMSAEECYKYRCSVLHQGRSAPETVARVDRIVFIEPQPKQARPILNFPPLRTDDGRETVLAIDLQYFLVEVTHAAGLWYEAIKDSEPFKTNFAGSLRRHETFPLSAARGHAVIA